MRSGCRPHRTERGFALILFVVLLVMAALYFVVGELDPSRMKSRRVTDTSQTMAQAKEALVAFAATYRDRNSDSVFGYLPCPDTADKSGIQVPGDGEAAASCGTAGQVAIGLLPYKSLGLPDLRDSDGNCLWYAVSGSHKNSPAATTPMNWDTQGQLGALAGDGSVLIAPEDPFGGAAAIIIAPGPPVDGQTRGAINQPCRADPAKAAEYLENQGNNFSHGIVKDADGKVIGNDHLLWITAKEIFERVKVRADFKNSLAATPPGQINGLADEIRAVLEKGIQDAILAGGTPTAATQPADQAYYLQTGIGPKQVGHLPTTLDLGSVGWNTYLTHWRDQYRYALCGTLGSGCFSVTGATTACRGLLLFAGQGLASGSTSQTAPRTTAQKPPATLALPAVAEPTYLTAYLEAGGGRDIFTTAGMSFTGVTSYPGAQAGADIGSCLFPGAFVSFAGDMAGFAAGTVNSSPTSPNAAVALADRTISLGNLPAAAPEASSGCVWYASPLPFSSLLRAYFRFQIRDPGQGFVFAIADAASNNPASASPIMCGGSGSLLGYAGPPPGGTTAGIRRPKIGLEIDLTSTTSSTSRYDPAGDHFAFVYWGGAGDNTVAPYSGNDDINHAAGITHDGSQPRNPRSLGTVAITGATWANGVATITTTTDHELSDQSVTVKNVSPAGFNNGGTSVAITVVDPTRFTYPLATDPGTYAGGGYVSAPRGIATTNASDPYLPYGGSLPLADPILPVPYNGTVAKASVIHVRVDIAKHYDAASQRGLYTLRAYIGDYLSPLGIGGTCTVDDFMNLSRDLPSLCLQTAKIEQHAVPIDDVAGLGEALAGIYVGFTTGRGTATADNQDIVVSNLLLRSQ